jgi:integrase/recombinase XerD
MKTLQDLARDYLDYERVLNFSPMTLRKRYYTLQGFLRWLEKTYDLRTPERLYARHLEGWLKSLHEHRTFRGTPLKARGINHTIVDVRAFLKRLVALGHVPHALLDALPYLRTPNLLSDSVLTDAQVRTLLDRVDLTDPIGYRNRTLLELMYSSALRALEVLALDPSAIDFQQGTARVMGKGRKERMVPIGKTALHFLETYLKAIRPYLLKDPDELALFLTHDGRRLCYRTLLQIVRRASPPELKMRVTPHTFRRSCATEMLRGGANMYHVKELLGHQTLDTLQHYARLTIEDLKKAHRKYHPRERTTPV